MRVIIDALATALPLVGLVSAPYVVALGATEVRRAWAWAREER